MNISLSTHIQQIALVSYKKLNPSFCTTVIAPGSTPGTGVLAPTRHLYDVANAVQNNELNGSLWYDSDDQRNSHFISPSVMVLGVALLALHHIIWRTWLATPSHPTTISPSSCEPSSRNTRTPSVDSKTSFTVQPVSIGFLLGKHSYKCLKNSFLSSNRSRHSCLYTRQSA